MQKAQVSKILQMVAEKDSLQLPRDRKKALRRVNAVREMLWHNEAFREGASRTDGCSLVEMFRENCRNCSCKPVYYTGIVLPPLVENLTEMLKDGQPVEIQFGRIDPQGCNTGCGSCLIAEELPKRLLERDIPFDLKTSTRVVFRIESPEDTGCLAGIRYVDFQGNEQREDLELHPDGVVTQYSVLQFLEITLPTRCGWISVMTEDGYKLGRYHPSISDPSHSHYRVNGTRPGDAMMWKGMQEPYHLVFDSDPVEFSDGIKWRLALALEEMISKTTMTAEERNGEANLTDKLRGFFASDLSAKIKTYNGKMQPRLSRSSLGTAALMSRSRGFRR